MSLRRVVWTVLFLCVCAGIKSQADEYSIKAMFLYKFIKYVEWPQETDKSVFKIGVCGNSEMFSALLALAKQKQIDNRPIEVIRLFPGDNTYCHVIFLGRDGHTKPEELARRWSGKGVLIITENNPDAKRGSAINLITMDNKVRFEINQTPARLAGIKISSELISMAQTVNP